MIEELKGMSKDEPVYNCFAMQKKGGFSDEQTVAIMALVLAQMLRKTMVELEKSRSKGVPEAEGFWGWPMVKE